MAGDAVNTGVEPRDHGIAERAVRLGFHGCLRKRETLAGSWLDNARRRKFGDWLAFANEMKPDFLLAARRGFPKSRLRFGHLSTPQLHPLVPPQVSHFMQVPFLSSVKLPQ